MRKRCTNCNREFNDRETCPDCRNDDGTDFALSLVVGMMTDNFLLGGLIGGDFAGGIVGDIFGDGELF